MTPVDFAYWMQGFFELSGDADITLTPQQVRVIRNHLNLVFVHAIDPSYTKQLPPEKAEEKQKLYNETHGLPANKPDPTTIYRC